MLFEIISTCNGGDSRLCRTNPPHPNAHKKGYVQLNRVLMENKLGRLLTKDEFVYDRDGLNRRCKIEYLELATRSEMAKRLNARRSTPVDVVCHYAECGKSFRVQANVYKRAQSTERGRSGSGRIYCCRKCFYADTRGRKRIFKKKKNSARAQGVREAPAAPIRETNNPFTALDVLYRAAEEKKNKRN